MSNLQSRRETRLTQTITKAINGDEGALELLDVRDRARLNFIPSRAVTKESLTADFNTYATRMLACAKVGNYSLEQACKRMLTYLSNYCQLRFNESIPASASIISKEKMLEEMLHLAGEVPFSRALNDAGTSSSSEEEDKEEREEEEGRPGAQPQEEEQCQEEEEEGESAKRPASSRAGPASKRSKRVDSQESERSSSSSSHHKMRKCQISGCSYYCPNLPRHIRVHVKRGKVAEDDFQRMREILLAGKRQRGAPIKDSKSSQFRGGRRKKWCAVPGCGRVVLDMPQHLTGTRHSSKRGSRLHNMYLQAAKPYTGLGEMKVILHPSQPESSSAESRRHTHQTSTVEGEAGAQSQEPRPSTVSGEQRMPAASRQEDSDTPVESESEQSDARTHDSSGESSLESEEEGEEEPAVTDADSDDPDFETSSLERFFNSKKPLNNRHTWLIGFYDFLARPSMGFKKQSIWLQHASQVRKILEAVEPGGSDINCLGKDKGEEAWRKFVRPILEKGSRKSGTVISHLSSYEKFLKFINTQYTDDMPHLDQQVKDMLKLSEGQIGGWRSVYDYTCIESCQQYLDESTHVLKPDEIKAIKKSSHYNKVLQYITQAREGRDLGRKEFIAVRDLILSRFSMDNGIRPGPLNNATLNDFYEAEEKVGVTVMLVAHHKRSKSGPAPCGMLPNLKEMVDVYVERVRHQYAASGNNKLFVTYKGEAFREGTIGRCVTLFLGKCGVRESRLAFVNLRKYVSTEAKERCTPQQQETVRRLMCHSEKTANRYYVRQSLTRVGAEGVRIIESFLQDDNTGEEPSSSQSTPPPASGAVEASPADASAQQAMDPAPETEESDTTSATCAATFVATSADTSPTTPDATSAATSPATPDATSATTSPVPRPATSAATSVAPSAATPPAAPAATSAATSAATCAATSDPNPQPRVEPAASTASTSIATVYPPTPGKDTLNQEQKQAVREVFRENIRTRQTVLQEYVRMKMASHKALRNLTFYPRRVKQVVNHVNYLIKTNADPHPEPPASTSSRRQQDLQDWLSQTDDRDCC